MFTLNDNVNNLYIDKELFYKIDDITIGLLDDDKHYTVLAMLGALAMASSRMPYMFTSFDMILMTMANNTSFEGTTKNRKGIMDGLNRLHNEKMIVLSEPLKDDKKQVITLDAKLLLHKEGNSFFQISRQELATIMTDKTPHHLAVVFCAMNSRFNMDSYSMFDDFKWNKYDYKENATAWKRYKHLSCYSTQEEFKTTWCSIPNKEGGYTVIERKEVWDISNRALTNIFNKLVDLELVSRVIRNIDGKNNSYYCRPIHAQCIEELLPILDGQVKHTKAKQQEVEPINDTIAEEQLKQQLKEEPKQITDRSSGRQKPKKWN